MKSSRLLVPFVALTSLAAASIGQAGEQRQSINLPHTEGITLLNARVGDVLYFDTTYLQSGSTGYLWRGPFFVGEPVFGKPHSATVQAKRSIVRNGKVYDIRPTPGNPMPESRRSVKFIPIEKPGKGTVTFIFSRITKDDMRQPGDKVCTFEFTVK